MAPIRFREWYKIKLGARHILLQVLLWWLYGFIWIPLWYLKTRHSNDVTMQSSTPMVSGALPSRVPATPASQVKRGLAMLAVGLVLLVMSPVIAGAGRDIPQGVLSGVFNGVLLSGFILPPLGLVFVAIGLVRRNRSGKVDRP